MTSSCVSELDLGDGFPLVPVVAGVIGMVLVVALVGGVLVLIKKGIIGEFPSKGPCGTCSVVHTL